MKIFGPMLVIAVAVGCGSEPAPQTEAPAGPPIQNVFQAELPPSAANAQVVTVRAMTAVVYGRFECSESDLQEFLAASALLPDKLEDGANPLKRIQAGKIAWWQPASLRDPSGIQCQWDDGDDVATCLLAAGESEESDLVTVYFMVVYEGKGQTGLRPTVKADPNWQMNREHASDGPGEAESEEASPEP